MWLQGKGLPSISDHTTASACTALSTCQERQGGNAGSPEEPFIPPPGLRQGCLRESHKAGMAPAPITSSASLVKDVPMCCPQAVTSNNCSIHLCPQHRNKFSCSGGSQHSGSIFCMAHLPPATEPRQSSSKLQPCLQGCHRA